MADPDFNAILADPRDAVIEAELALWGVIELLTESKRDIQSEGIQAILRLIHERLGPAADALQAYQPQK